MPQLDPTWFVSQLFWLAVSFALMYVMMRFFILPRITGVMDDRQNQIDGNLRASRDLKDEAQNAIRSYEEAMAKAHSQAAEIIRKSGEELAAFTKEEESRFALKLKQHSDEAKNRIEAAKDKVLLDAHDFASELVGRIVYKITSEHADKDSVRHSVEKAFKEERL